MLCQIEANTNSIASTCDENKIPTRWTNYLTFSMSLHSDTLSRIWPNQSLLLLLNGVCSRAEAANTNFIVFGFITRPGLTSTINALKTSTLAIILLMLCQFVELSPLPVVLYVTIVCCHVILVWLQIKLTLSTEKIKYLELTIYKILNEKR